MILGIDEVGRGPWAGPLVVGAVVLGGREIAGLTDSKKLTKKRREILYEEIYADASGVGIGWVSAPEIDTLGLSESLRLATKRAVRQITAPFHEVIIDGTINFLADTPLEHYVTTLKKADLLVPSVSAASIVAKVARDRYMAEQDDLYEGYSFGAHVGYGTAAHRTAIEQRGVTPLHRLSFAPLRKYRDEGRRSVQAEGVSDTPSTKVIGDRAEDAVAQYLEGRGHTIVARNWKTRVCEIDIVSFDGETVFFTEVKYRKSDEWGDGLSAITVKKQRQMRYAVAVFGSYFKQLAAYNQRLCAASVSGAAYTVDEWLELD